MELKMEVYTPALELVGMIEIQRSIIWEEYAFKAGSFSFDSLITPDVTALLVPDNIIWITGDTAGIIESIQEKADENGPYITVKGPLLTGILSRRILWGRYQMSGTPAAIMYQLVDDCAINPTRGDDTEARKIPGLTLSTVPSGGTAIRKQQTGGTLLEALEEIGEAYQTAFGVRFDPAVPRMVFWARQGVDRAIKQNVNEPVFYSTELEDVLSSEYIYNSQEYRNIALVAGEDEGENRVHVVVGGSGGSTPQPPKPPEPEQHTVSISVDPSGSGTATGAGTYQHGAQATVTATPATGYRFVNWQENGTEINKNAKYTFTVNSNRNLTAVFTAIALLEPWTAATLPSLGNWRSVTYGNGRFVAVADYNSKTAAYSTDGVTWAAVTLPSSVSWQSVTYGNGRFVAVENNKKTAAYSIDGITWTTTTLPSSAGWRSVTYGDGKFVAVAKNSIIAAYSADGITWETARMPSSANWYGVTYGNGRFVAVANNNDIAAYSVDGITWEKAKMPSSANWYSVAYGNGQFVAVTESSDVSAYSTDGVTWTATTLPSSAKWHSVTYGNDRFIAVAQSCDISAYSLDGITWETIEMPSWNWQSVTYGNGRFVAVAYGRNVAAYCKFKSL